MSSSRSKQTPEQLRQIKMRQNAGLTPSLGLTPSRNPGPIAGIHAIHPAHHHRDRIKIALFNKRIKGRHAGNFFFCQRSSHAGI